MSSEASKHADGQEVATEYGAEQERTRPSVPHARIHPEWLSQGRWVLIRRNGRFGCIVGEHQHSPRTVFEVVVCADGTRYLIPLDEVIRVLRPVADPNTAEHMLRILRGRDSEVGNTLMMLRQELCSNNWANHLPETAAGILRGCYRNNTLRRDECEQPFRRLEGLVLTEISLALGVALDTLLREVRAVNGVEPQGG